MSRVRSAVYLFLPALLIALALEPLPAGAGRGTALEPGPSPSLPAGFDLFETDPEVTEFRFGGGLVIPAGFFAPGSAPFRGRVNFGGVSVETFQGAEVGTTDTIVERKESAEVLPPFPSSDTIDIELVALSLRSVAPIIVQVKGEPQLWDVRAEPSPSRPSTGTMTIDRTHQGGGTFSSQLNVVPMFTFTRRSDGASRTLDVGGLRVQQSDGPLTLRADGVPWVYGCPPPLLDLRRLTGGFCAGATSRGPVLVQESAQFARHGVRPARFIERDVFASAAASILLASGGTKERVELTGRLRIDVVVGRNGEAQDGDRDGLDEVQTRLVELELRGNSPTFGPVKVRLRDESQDPFKPSTGTLEEKRNRTPGRLELPPFATAGRATSFFDVFIEIEVGGRELHHRAPLPLQAIVTAKPAGPGDTFVGIARRLLRDEDGRRTRFEILQIRLRPTIISRAPLPHGGEPPEG